MIYYIVLPFLSAALASAWWIFYFKELSKELSKEKQRSFDLQQELVAANERFAIYQSTVEKKDEDEDEK